MHVACMMHVMCVVCMLCFTGGYARVRVTGDGDGPCMLQTQPVAPPLLFTRTLKMLRESRSAGNTSLTGDSIHVTA